MKTPRNCIKTIAGGLLLVVLSCVHLWAEEVVYAPEYLWKRGIAQKTNPIDIANMHVGMPYRDDGTLDDKGRFTTFERPDKFFNTPGLNCSGLVLSVSRFIFDKNWTLEDASRDRLGYSGPDSDLGKDWDFGWNLIMNITQGTRRRVLMPDGKDHPIEQGNGLSLRGFDIHDESAWKRVLPMMRPGRVYLATISKSSRRQGYKVLHYHVALMLPDNNGSIWLYHATHLSKVHSMDIATREGLRRFLWEMRRTNNEPKYILIVESIPYSETTVASTKDEDPPNNTAPPVLGRQAGAEGHDALDVLGAGPVAAQSIEDQPHAPQGQPEPLEQPAPKPAAQLPAQPELVINHLSGKVFQSFLELSAHIPKLSGNKKETVALWFRNDGDAVRQIDIVMEGPDGAKQVRRQIQPGGRELTVRYPQDFGGDAAASLRTGKYKLEVRVDGKKWCGDIFDVALPQEAAPKVVEVKAPAMVTAGQTFSLRIVAENRGAESDYGGITVSCPDPSALRIDTAKPGKVFRKGSTVLSVTTDRMQTAVPMAEQWIELWGEGKRYEMTVGIKALGSGTFPVYVRCAIRGVNVKSSVVLMDPAQGEVVDQQGFPVYVHKVTVR